MTAKNEALIARVRDALKYDLNELNTVFDPLLHDVIAALEGSGELNMDLTRSLTEEELDEHFPSTVFLMEPTEQTEGDGRNTEAQTLAYARDYMEANPLPCIAETFIVGDRANFKVRNAVASCDEFGFTLSDSVGWCSIVVAAKVIMLHINRAFGVSAAHSYEYEHGWIVEFDRELTEEETKHLADFLGQ
jgi:hypothetical protein